MLTALILVTLRQRCARWLGKLMHSRGSAYQKTRSTYTAIAGAAVADGKPAVSVEMPGGMTTGWNARMLRNNLRVAGALVLLLFVVCHLTAHSLLLVSFERAE